MTGYEYVFIDCPPSLGPLTESAIAAADIILIPCQMEARAADGLVDLLEVVHIIKGEAFDRWRILLTRVDNRRSVTNEVVLESLAPWKVKILNTTIPQSEPLNQAQIQRTDIFTFDPKCKGALAYQSLIEKEMQRLMKDKRRALASGSRRPSARPSPSGSSRPKSGGGR